MEEMKGDGGEVKKVMIMCLIYLKAWHVHTYVYNTTEKTGKKMHKN